MVGEFRSFLLKTNALALAIGVIIGTALGTVVNSLVNDIIMPPIGLLLGGVDFASLKLVLKAATGGDPATEVAIRWGAFVNALHHRLRGGRLRRLAHLEDVHQGRGRGRDEGLPLLHGGERTGGDEVSRLRQSDLRLDEADRIGGSRDRMTYGARRRRDQVASRCKGPRSASVREGVRAWPP